MRTLILAFMSFTLNSCGAKQKFEKKISEKKCEEALEALPENQNEYKLISKTQETTGTLLSYAATGTAYTVQVLWDVTATFSGVVVLCAPTFIATAAPRNSVNYIEPMCLPGV